MLALTHAFETTCIVGASSEFDGAIVEGRHPSSTKGERRSRTVVGPREAGFGMVSRQQLELPDVRKAGSDSEPTEVTN